MDTKALKWCYKDCKQMYPLKVTDERLTFEDADRTDLIQQQLKKRIKALTAVNRRTGAYEGSMIVHYGEGDIVDGEDTVATVEGNCEKKPFTPFPTVKF